MSKEYNTKDCKQNKSELSKKGGTLAIAWGKYGGFGYYSSGYTRRLCLGWLALYYFPEEIEEILTRLLEADK